MFVFSDNEKIASILKQIGEANTEKEFSSLVAKVEKKSEIPGFYISHKIKDENIASLINSWATTRSIIELKKRFPTKKDVKALDEAFQKMNSSSSFPSLSRSSSGRVLRYPQYLQLRESWPDELQPILSSRLFIEVGGSSMHTCNYDALLLHVETLSRCSKHFSYILKFDLSRTGYISNKDFKDYISHFSLKFSFVKAETEDFRKQYIEFASQQFLVVLDPLCSGKVVIERLLNDVLFMFFVMVDGWTEDRVNPFSTDVLGSFVADFKNMDLNHDGKLEPNNLMYMNKLRLTSAFANRAADAIAFNNGVLNFEWYVRFRVAWFSLGESFANSYFFDVIDIDGDGVITQYEINYFYREINKTANEAFPESRFPPYDFIVSQLFDQCQASDQRITRKKFIESKATEVFVKRMCDVREYTIYEIEKDCGSLQPPIPDVLSL